MKPVTQPPPVRFFANRTCSGRASALRTPCAGSMREPARLLSEGRPIDARDVPANGLPNVEVQIRKPSGQSGYWPSSIHRFLKEKFMNHKQFLVAAAASLLFAGAAIAHGDEDHAAKPDAKPAADAAGHAHEHGESDAIGEAGATGKVDRTVTVTMTDSMRFVPENVAVKQGETIKFVVKNAGQLRHEMVLGTEKELKEHYEMMKKFPEMEHADPQQVTVAPGKTGEIVWRFTKSGKIDFACLQPGHYDAGMKGIVTVAAVKGASAKGDGHSDHKH